MNEIVKFTPKIPAHLRNAEISEVTKALAGGGATGKRVSIKGGVFRLIVNGNEVGKVDDRHLDVVIVAAAPKISRTYYATTYDDDAKPTAPDCWSPDGDAPDPSVENPQHSRCLSCPQNAKGSGKGDSKACRYNQRVAVVLANDMEGDVLQLSLPATSLFGDEAGDDRPLQAYSRWLTAQNISVDMVVTRMKFDTDAATPKLFFKPVRWLDETEYALCLKQGKSHDAQQAISYTVSQQDGVQAKPKAALPAPEDEDTPPPKPKAKAKPAPEPEDEPPPPKPKAKAKPAPEPEEEPVVRKAETPAPVKKSLATILGDWDDEDEG